MIQKLKKTFSLAVGLLVTFSLLGQEVTVHGTVKDPKGDPLIGSHIRIRDTNIGTITEPDGSFELRTTHPVPFQLIISSIGMANQQYTIETVEDQFLDISLEEATLFGEEIVVSASRVEENILQASASIEKLTITDLQLTAAPSFFDELYKLKGVDMIVQSLTFRFPNSRGFNGTTNYRLNQIVDGVDNQSPGLSFAAGNIFGLSQLDIESVELLVGASSALYGPGGMNGTLVMTSKNPFDYQGLSFSAQTGIMHLDKSYTDSFRPLQDYNLRYATQVGERFAFKVTGSYLSANDWHASDFRDKRDLSNEGSTRWTHSAFDGVNIYGDDSPVSLGAFEEDVAIGFVEAQFPDLVPGSPEYQEQIDFIKDAIPNVDVTRTGWKEQDLVNYDTENIRLGGGLYYKLNKHITASLQSNFGRGTAVYSAQNRFSLNDFWIVNYKAELTGRNFFVRFFGVNENSGQTYDAGGLAAFINEGWKPSEDWFADYIEGFLVTKLGFGFDDQEAHKQGRYNADNRNEFGNVLKQGEPAWPLPGSEQFNTLKREISSTDLKDGGAQVFDQSSMYQAEVMYNFKDEIKAFELLVGSSFRYNFVNSNGTVFFDEPGNPIGIYQIGAYTQLSDQFGRLKPTLSVRYDKNEYFKGKVTPRLSAVVALGNKNERYIRASAQTAFRFPAVQDQWNDLVVGPLFVVGGQPVVQAQYDFGTNPVYPLDGSNPIFSNPITDEEFVIPKFGPEKVTAFEIGYQGLYLGKRLWFDGYVYFNRYNGFLAQQLLAQNPDTDEEVRYQTTISLDDPVNAYGWAVGFDYRMPRGFSTGGNLSYNGVDGDAINDPGYQLQFNTPDYRFNVYVNNRKLTDKLGFSLNYRWQNNFLWESPFGVGEVPAFGTLDGQISWKLDALKSLLKLGGSNLLNQYYTTSFGSAQVGAIYYISLTFDEMFNY